MHPWFEEIEVELIIGLFKQETKDDDINTKDFLQTLID